MTEEEQVAAAEEAEARRRGLPTNCECGGEMEYSFSFGRVWSVCKKCTPIVHVKWNKRGTLDVIDNPEANR